MRYIKNLNGLEREALQEGQKNGSTYRFRNRCKAILLSSDGYSVNQIRELFEINRVNTIYDWYNRWEAEGIEGLKDKPGRGRKPKLENSNEAHVKLVKKLVKQESQNLNKVKVELENILGIKLSKKTLKRFLKNLTFDGDVLEHALKKDKTPMSI